MRFPIPPSFSSLAKDVKDYFTDWFDALFTQIENYETAQLAPTGITGEVTCQISRMGRTAIPLIRFTGASTSGTISLPVNPLGSQVLGVERMTTVPTSLGYAGIDENGLVSLPDFIDGADVLVSGLILERD